MDKLIFQQQKDQEKLALEMLKSVEAIKNNSLVARKIVTSDNNVKKKVLIYLTIKNIVTIDFNY